MRPSVDVLAAPPPPSGLPPPRPPGLHRESLHDRPRRSHAPVRSLSHEPGLDRRSIAEPGDDDAETAAASRPAGHNILVAVRCRALLQQEISAGGHGVIKIQGGQTVVLEDPQTTAADDYLRLNKSKERRYMFDAAFDQTVFNHEVYERTTRFLIASVLQGFNATVFAYGATSAGKTHTMLGYADEPGIMLLTLRDLFTEVSSQKSDNHIEVKCSFLEVYNENVRDLLRPDGDFLDIREDPVKGMCVAGISEVGGLESAEEIMALLQQANKHRTTESTGANITSSRSHAVLQVTVHQRDRAADIVAKVNLGKLSMIDLAGSERASHTNNKGMRMIEGANINRSLLALGNCITALSSAVSFVPYRDSKMTRLLKDSLGGNCRTVMIANVSPCHINYEDTHNTLKYANRAKNIKTKAFRNVVQLNVHASKYTDIIQDLRGEIKELKAKLTVEPDLSAEASSLAVSASGDVETERDTVQSVKWKQELMQNFEDRVRIKRRLIDLAHETKNQMVQKSHAQVGISQWESGRHSDADDGPTPTSIRDLQEQLKFIKSELAKNEEATSDLEGMLLENQEKAEKLQQELPRRVKNKDMRAFLGLVSRIYVMEVENMDMQEMVDVTAPLLEQKELEAEALRLQIQLRDRMIEEQDQLLAGEDQDAVEKPEGWIEIPTRAPKRVSNAVRWLDDSELSFASGADDLGSPARRRYKGYYSGADPPTIGIGGRRAASEGPSQVPFGLSLPPISPGSSSRPGEPASSTSEKPRSNRQTSSSPSAAPGSARPGSASGSASAIEVGEASKRGRPLDVAGRGLGLPPRPAPIDERDAPVKGVSGKATPDKGHDSEVDLDSTQLPVVEGQAPIGIHRLTSAQGVTEQHKKSAGVGSSIQRGIAARRKGTLRERGENSSNGAPLQLQVEASGLRNQNLEDSQGSGSEREREATKSPTLRTGKADAVPEKVVFDRQNVVSKLSKLKKPGQENISSAKH
eukprot:TRINITY_DN27167_c0_g5_i1.p1 TRINITY_DN27167_c0_g5~~TRINITY_DN27167_c0_g5_i1.p1  ORF type:complete len:978 (-),score=188.26 TRINITY_DN27167_c0_g5_i1:18-2951(-)